MDPLLIVGAGPTGLAAALFLASRGVSCRIVDMAVEPSRTSKALAVNPRTLALLASTGVSDRIVAEGRPIERVVMRRGGRTVLELEVAGVDPAWPMIDLPQARTEALLTEALAMLGVRPERGVELKALSQDAGPQDAGVQNTGVQDTGPVVARLARADGAIETVRTPILFGADGAHSAVRRELGVDFPGSSFPEPWRLADVEFEAPVQAPEGYIDLYPHGLVFALMFTPTRWRFISSIGDPLETLPPGARVKDTPWRSDFHISHRIAERLNVGRVCLGGDAAHLHSPVGARGMNLGIEDAYVFAALAAETLETGAAGRLEAYGRLRHAVDQGVVRRVEAISRMARGEGAWSLVRQIAPRAASGLTPLRHMIVRTIVGLDHPVRLS